MCALDAFDCLPHPIILQKVMGVVPDMYWRILYVWYAKMCVFLRWNNVLGNKIKVNQGTRQGGLTSPWIFNLFYQELIDDLNDMNVGVSIGGHNFNVICYADDILLCSTGVCRNGERLNAFARRSRSFSFRGPLVGRLTEVLS